MRLFVALAVLLVAFTAQPNSTQAQHLPGTEWLTPEERSAFNDRFAGATDSATRARIRQEQIKLIQQRRLDARKLKNPQKPTANQ
ncbi:hypothetical protein V5T82_17290 [Magnetovibrio sp. PR-2]|uniref:hypothetical protein n=1 Tax=Magnetovibrio sp. PR-2 TaxID=3120356 RepID=UPI002FCE530B